MTSDGPDGPDPRAARWTDLTGDAKGSTYDARWAQLAAEGRSVHGEADLIDDLMVEGDRSFAPPPTVLDAGCGTGRIAIELDHRGIEVIGVDRDPDLLAAARSKAPHLRWVEADLVDVGRIVEPRSLQAAVLAGNVMIFVDPGTEAAVVAAVAGTLAPDGLLVTGFQVRPDGVRARPARPGRRRRRAPPRRPVGDVGPGALVRRRLPGQRARPPDRPAGRGCCTGGVSHPLPSPVRRA